LRGEKLRLVNFKIGNLEYKNKTMKSIFTLIFFSLAISGFSQSYLGIITKNVNFRVGSSCDYKIISSLKPNNQIYIISLETENDYYNIIDIATDKEGYVHKSYVKVGKLVT
jgi:uncharacterized protein YgiM (DUF1202 family)